LSELRVFRSTGSETSEVLCEGSQAGGSQGNPRLGLGTSGFKELVAVLSSRAGDRPVAQVAGPSGRRHGCVVAPKRSARRGTSVVVVRVAFPALARGCGAGQASASAATSARRRGTTRATVWPCRSGGPTTCAATATVVPADGLRSTEAATQRSNEVSVSHGIHTVGRRLGNTQASRQGTG